MSKKRNEYIDQLLSDLKLLEERILSVKESDTLPFSFFSASFDRIEKISRSLHELELMQIGEMKEQMERLVKFLSESDVRSNAVKEPEHSEKPVYSDQPTESDSLDLPVQPDPPHQSDHLSDSSEKSDHSDLPEPSSIEVKGIFKVEEKVSVTERIILPEYRDPRISEVVTSSATTAGVHLEKNGHEKSVARSLNDIIQAPPALLDLRRRISLNDRFLFQRELFNNNRAEMNSVMEKLNTLGSFEEIENYLRSEQNWNFENEAVKEFLLVIKKGFE